MPSPDSKSSAPSKPEDRAAFEKWFSANYYTIDPVAKNSMYAAWQAASSGIRDAATAPPTRFDCQICGDSYEPCKHWMPEQLKGFYAPAPESTPAVLKDNTVVEVGTPHGRKPLRNSSWKHCGHPVYRGTSHCEVCGPPTDKMVTVVQNGRDGQNVNIPAPESTPAPLRDPTQEELKSPRFNAVWEAIKKWDLKREHAAGYAGATGTDVCTILDAIDRAAPVRKPVIMSAHEFGRKERMLGPFEYPVDACQFATAYAKYVVGRERTRAETAERELKLMRTAWNGAITSEAAAIEEYHRLEGRNRELSSALAQARKERK